MNPLSERMVFNKKYEEINVEFHTDKEAYETHEKVISTLILKDYDNQPLAGHFSVAITDDNDIAVDSSTTILSSLLLASELKGYIENPTYYLQDGFDQNVALDYLMMTHGWRRYNIPDVVKGNFSSQKIPFQISQEISGTVKGLFPSRPVADSQISLLTSEGGFGTVSTNEKGNFFFQDFEFPDSTSYIIQARSKKGSNKVELVLDREIFPKLIYATQTPVNEILSLDSEIKAEPEINKFIAKAEQRSKYDQDMRAIQLSEVVITGYRNERKDEPRLQYWGNIGSDKTIRREEFEKRNPNRVSDILRGVAGVMVYPNGIVTIRQAGQEGLPLVLLDGMQIPWPERVVSPFDSPIEYVPVTNVESIDIYKGVNPFGMRGAYGVISITTRRGGSSGGLTQFNFASYTPLGYQKPVEFYSPKYEILEARQLNIPDFRTTIYWKPDVVISDSGENAGKESFDFYTSDIPTTYSVVIEGLTTDGGIVRRVEKIVVR